MSTSRHSSRLNYTPNMQMVFVDSDDSDKGSNPDVEVYYENTPGRCSNSMGDYDGERIASCDSGYVAEDALDYNIEHVTDKPRKNSLEPVEASARILQCIQLHEDSEMHRLLERDATEQMTKVHSQNIDELNDLKEALEKRISQVNSQLVDELLMRDELYSYHESLLLDADDLTRSASEETIITPTESPSKSSNTDKKQSESSNQQTLKRSNFFSWIR